MASSNSAKSNWTSTQAYVLAAICLLLGIAVGWLLRGSAAPAPAATAAMANTAAPTGAMTGQPTPEQMKHMADKQAEPLLQRLKTSPDDAALLASIGNIYYDAQQFKDAIDYYQRSAKLAPDADVLTDMGTAYFNLGEIDTALATYDTALRKAPNHPNTLFNMGMVKWQGKMDINGAIAAWQKLLDTNPNYPNRDRVVALIAQAKQHANIKPGTKTDRPAE